MAAPAPTPHGPPDTAAVDAGRPPVYRPWGWAVLTSACAALQSLGMHMLVVIAAGAAAGAVAGGTSAGAHGVARGFAFGLLAGFLSPFVAAPVAWVLGTGGL